MFQESEIITLMIGSIGLWLLLRFFKESDIPGLKYLKAGCALMICAYIFTLVEGVLFLTFFNFLEHVCYALSGLMFALGFWKMSGR